MNMGPQAEPQNEFGWEETLRESDVYAARYFKLLRRFADLPDADALIAKHLGADFQDYLTSCDNDCEKCAHRWQCEFSAEDDDDENFLEELSSGIGDEKNCDIEDDVQPGDALFYESHPAFQMMRHCSFGWCNIYAAILSPQERKPGLRTLCHIGRSLAHLVSSIGDGLYDTPAASIAFAKRSLTEINAALGEIHNIDCREPGVKQLMTAMQKHLLTARSAIFDHLQQCREINDTEEN